MENKSEYCSLLGEIIAKQAVILGPEIAILKARNVPGLVVSAEGKVEDFSGPPEETLKQLVDQYVELSGLIVKNALGSIFAKYPSIKTVE